jgi:hypothetical protein
MDLDNMNRKFVSLILPIVAFLGVQGLPKSIQAASPIAKSAKLEHMDYFSARKLILSYGWSPMSGPCEQVSGNTCARFPEIGSCSGVDPGYCGMVFVKQNRCLYITTTGGEPEGDGEGDTHVEKVTFRGGPCSKN